MGNEKEESGFGFKDRAKAEETLRLLQQHEPNYRRLTVRGLLGRAKRVLAMTKAEDKIKNIKEAMEVFENWLAELDANKEKKPDKKKDEKKKEENKRTSSEDKESSGSGSGSGSGRGSPLPAEGVAGLGFKDGGAARESLRRLRGRDPDYQLLAVRGLLGRARRVITCTRDETKQANIKEAISILEEFVDDFESCHRGRDGSRYLGLGLLRAALPRAGPLATDLHRSFAAAYSGVRGQYKRLRNVTADGGDGTWDVVRNQHLQPLKEKYANAKMFNENDEPTQEHLEMILWAYSPEPARLKKLFNDTTNEINENKDGGDADVEMAEKKDRDSRKRRSSSHSDDADAPSKKKKDE